MTGISLGSPYTDAVNKLASEGFHNNPVKFPEDWQAMSATLASKKAPYGDGKQHLQEDFVVQALNGKVVYVDHAVVFDEKAKPNDQDTVNSLIKNMDRKRHSRMTHKLFMRRAAGFSTGPSTLTEILSLSQVPTGFRAVQAGASFPAAFLVEVT